jgi:ferric-dicitrate binding protein FerR (iron transport regulator)
MTDTNPPDRPLEGLIEDYLNGTLDEPRMRDLEARLLADPAARRLFVRYARLHTDLLLELRARKASERVLDAIDRDLGPASPRTATVVLPRSRRLRRVVGLLAAAAGLLLAVGIGWRVVGPGGEAVAWLVNAQNCTWTDGGQPGDLLAGRTLGLDRGLAEVHFRGGARVVLEGPAELELLSAGSARLRRGRLTARVPAGAAGFEVLCPHGKVTDLGTEFGLSVSPTGAADVYVFEGAVEAHPAGGPGKLNLTRHQAARIAPGQVTVGPSDPGRFVRAIVPARAVVPRDRKLTFDRPVEDTLQDISGAGTGLTHRLPGTGYLLPGHDENLRLVPARGQLELTTTPSDLNTQHRLGRGEYLGLRLADLGFTGVEDFEVSATFPAIPALAGVGQFGLYAGAGSDRVIRGGVHAARRGLTGEYTQFLVNNADGTDTDPYRVGLLTTGTDLRVTLRREAGRYTLAVENLTGGGASTLTTRHPTFLDGEPDLYVGLFGANTQSDVRRTLVVRDFQATVWVAAPER